MQVAGLEPARSRLREILSLLCLPIPPYLHIIYTLVNAFVCRTSFYTAETLTRYTFSHCQTF